MGSVTTIIADVVGTEKSIAVRNTDSLFRQFKVMRDEALDSPAKFPASLNGKSISSTQRLFVRIYFAPTERDQPIL
jgi:hypothetical protein